MRQKEKLIKSDIVFTPIHIATWIINYFSPNGKILDPCMGNGAFYNQFPGEKFWCEITLGRDFFEYKQIVDWIITNPPFTRIEDFMEHAFKLSKNVVYLLPAHKTFSSWKRIRLIEDYGGIKTILLIKGQQCNFPFRYPYGVFYFKKKYKGPTLIKNCEHIQELDGRNK